VLLQVLANQKTGGEPEKKRLLKKAEETWAMNILQRVKDGMKVTHNDIERATRILGGDLDEDGRDELEESHPATTAVLDTELPRWAKNQTALADVLKVERKTIQRWRKEPNFPRPQSNGKWDVHAVRDWCKARGKKIFSGEDKEEEKYDLEVRRLKAICESLELKLSVERGEYVLISEVYEQVSMLVAAVKTQMLHMPTTLAPTLIAIEDIHEMQDRLKDAIDECLRSLHEDEWVEKAEELTRER
tara:strand:+ start:2415 stop:3149 length:735 start_codon:yes stop_codon:yes gene_type:complete